MRLLFLRWKENQVEDKKEKMEDLYSILVEIYNFIII